MGEYTDFLKQYMGAFSQNLPDPKQLQSLLSPQQTRLQAGLLGASSGVLPLMGVRDRPVGLGEVLLAAGTGAQAGLQQKEQSDLARALQGLELGTKLYEVSQGDGLSERELRLQDFQNTLGVDRATAIKLDKGLLRPDQDERGNPILVDITTGRSTRIKTGPTISQTLSEESGISTAGEDLVESQIPKFLTKAPEITQEAYTKNEKTNAIELKGATDIALNSMNELASIIKQKPYLAGFLGLGARYGKDLSGVLSDIGLGKITDLTLSKDLQQAINDPDVSKISVLEGNIVSSLADVRAIKGNRSPTIQDTETERERLGITGFTSSQSVLERLRSLGEELNKKSKLYQGLSGGFNEEIYGDLVKDYSLDPMFQNLFSNQVSLDGTRSGFKNDKPDPLGFR